MLAGGGCARGRGADRASGPGTARRSPCKREEGPAQAAAAEDIHRLAHQWPSCGTQPGAASAARLQRQPAEPGQVAGLAVTLSLILCGIGLTH